MFLWQAQEAACLLVKSSNSSNSVYHDPFDLVST